MVLAAGPAGAAGVGGLGLVDEGVGSVFVDQGEGVGSARRLLVAVDAGGCDEDGPDRCPWPGSHQGKVGGVGVGLGDPVAGVGVAVLTFDGDEPAEVFGMVLAIASAGGEVVEVGGALVGCNGGQAVVVEDLGVRRAGR